MHPLGNVNSLSGQLQLPLPKEDDSSFWQLSVKVRTKKVHFAALSRHSVFPFPAALSGKSRSAGWKTGGLR
jgi:hypothetical protein